MMAETPTKIGIVSKHAHCKSHITALAKDGFDVVALGGSPTSIPPSIDVVVVRTQSCAHGGSDAALEWSRKTGKRIIMENGLSGIRRALKEDPKAAEQLRKYTRAAEILLRDRPEDTPEQVRDTLVAMGADLATATKVVETIDILNPTTESEVSTVELFPHPYPEPTDGTWAALVPERRARGQAEIGLQVYNSLDPEVRAAMRDAFMDRKDGDGPYFPSSRDKMFKGRKWKAVRDLQGKPHQFSTVLLLCLPMDEPYHRLPLHRAYQNFSGKRTDGRTVEAAAWATGHTVIREKKQTSKPAAPVEPPVEAPADLTEQWINSIKHELEEQILDMMGQMDRLQKENESLRTEVKGLRTEVSTLRDLVATYEEDLNEDTEERAPEDSAIQAIGQLKEALDGLREKGAEVSLKIKL